MISDQKTYTKLLKIVCEMNKIFDNANEQITKDNSDEHWSIAYDQIFSEKISKKIYKKFHKLNIQMHYYDPDSSYEDDVRAYVNAVNEKLEEITKNQ